MRNLERVIATAAFIFASPITATAQNYTSAYTKLIFDQHCTITGQYELGVSAKCAGYTEPGMPGNMEWPVYFSEGDVRQMVRFGRIREKSDRWESFGEFNRVGETIEWRLNGTKPVAAILRWFIENANPNNGLPDKKHEGQVLVISTVADFDNPDNACVAGYVDARTNKNANVLARQVADSIAPQFQCDADKPKFYGKRGALSGSPTYLSE